MKKLLLVIDMQIDFIDGALGTPEAEAIVDKVVEKMKTYPTANIIATRDTHTPDYLHTQEGRNLPVKHCIQGTLGWQLHPAVAAALGEGQIMDKPTFGSIDLMHQLVAEHQREPLALVLVGLCTDICVAMPEVEITVDAACCAGVTPETHRAALATMGQCQIAIENG